MTKLLKLLFIEHFVQIKSKRFDSKKLNLSFKKLDNKRTITFNSIIVFLVFFNFKR